MTSLRQNYFIKIIVLTGYVFVVVVVFHSPSTLVMSFRVRPVNLSTLFLGKLSM